MSISLKRESGENPELTRSGKREQPLKKTLFEIKREVEVVGETTMVSCS